LLSVKLTQVLWCKVATYSSTFDALRLETQFNLQEKLKPQPGSQTEQKQLEKLSPEFLNEAIDVEAGKAVGNEYHPSTDQQSKQ